MNVESLVKVFNITDGVDSLSLSGREGWGRLASHLVNHIARFLATEDIACRLQHLERRCRYSITNHNITLSSKQAKKLTDELEKQDHKPEAAKYYDEVRKKVVRASFECGLQAQRLTFFPALQDMECAYSNSGNFLSLLPETIKIAKFTLSALADSHLKTLQRCPNLEFLSLDCTNETRAHFDLLFPCRKLHTLELAGSMKFSFGKLLKFVKVSPDVKLRLGYRGSMDLFSMLQTAEKETYKPIAEQVSHLNLSLTDARNMQDEHVVAGFSAFTNLQALFLHAGAIPGPCFEKLPSSLRFVHIGEALFGHTSFTLKNIVQFVDRNPHCQIELNDEQLKSILKHVFHGESFDVPHSHALLGADAFRRIASRVVALKLWEKPLSTGQELEFLQGRHELQSRLINGMSKQEYDSRSSALRGAFEASKKYTQADLKRVLLLFSNVQKINLGRNQLKLEPEEHLQTSTGA